MNNETKGADNEKQMIKTNAFVRGARRETERERMASSSENLTASSVIKLFSNSDVGETSIESEKWAGALYSRGHGESTRIV
jgi:hypothetical protein